jgi:hypothetical protein
LLSQYYFFLAVEDESRQYDYVPIEPGRLARLLSQYLSKFGVVFAERSQEAIKCYNANAYLACCAMCGAATESIILSLAITKTNDEAQVIKDYSTRGGRGKIENLIIGQKQGNIKDEFISSTGLLKYWRDISAHGSVSGITDNEAFTSLALLLRFSQFVNDKWDELIS